MCPRSDRTHNPGGARKATGRRPYRRPMDYARGCVLACTVLTCRIATGVISNAAYVRPARLDIFDELSFHIVCGFFLFPSSASPALKQYCRTVASKNASWLGRAVYGAEMHAVENLGGDSTAGIGRETSHLANLENLNSLAKVLTKHGFFRGKVGGGGRSRTYDAADMSRVL